MIVIDVKVLVILLLLTVYVSLASHYKLCCFKTFREFFTCLMSCKLVCIEIGSVCQLLPASTLTCKGMYPHAREILCCAFPY